jgi:hypothetical protein
MTHQQLTKMCHYLINRYDDSGYRYNFSWRWQTCQRWSTEVKTLPTFCKALPRYDKSYNDLRNHYNALVNRITIQGIVTMIPYVWASLPFCKGYSSSLICTLLILGDSQCITDQWIINFSHHDVTSSDIIMFSFWSKHTRSVDVAVSVVFLSGVKMFLS